MEEHVQQGYFLTEYGLVSESNGEVKKPVCYIVEEGAEIISVDAQKIREMQAELERLRKQQYKEMISKQGYRKLCRTEWDSENGGKRNNRFLFVNAEINFDGIPTAMVTRLIYLSTFAEYTESRDGLPLVRNGVPIRRRDIAKVLRISESGADKFWKVIRGKYIYADKKGRLYLASNYFARGSLRRNDMQRYQRVYFSSVRKLYEDSNGKRLNQLGYIFMMLPYINAEHNILCHNPLEADKDRVQVMTPKEFCEQIDYDYSHLNRLMTAYRDILFDVNGRLQHFCKLITNWNDQENATICINPGVIYGGSAEGRLKVNEDFFKEKIDVKK